MELKERDKVMRSSIGVIGEVEEVLPDSYILKLQSIATATGSNVREVITKEKFNKLYDAGKLVKLAPDNILQTGSLINIQTQYCPTCKKQLEFKYSGILTERRMATCCGKEYHVVPSELYTVVDIWDDMHPEKHTL